MNHEKQNLSRSKRWVIAYDISDHRQRRLIHTLLKDHGQRVQFSVFECELSKKQQQALRIKLTEYMEEGDSVRWYPLCSWCKPKVEWTGNGQAPQSDDFHII